MSEELRNYITERIKNIKREKVLKEIMDELKKLRSVNVPKNFSIKSIREDRDSYWCFSFNRFIIMENKITIYNSL